MSGPKILIIYTSAGSGHLMAARALTDALTINFPEVRFLSVDALDYTNLIHRKVYANSYLSLVNYLPTVWGYLYHQTDVQNRAELFRKLISFIDKINAGPLVDLIKEFEPDQIICTHYLGAELINTDKDLARFPTSVVITDYDAHNLWIYPAVKKYFVATEEVAAILDHKRVSRQQIQVTGIPVRGQFLEKRDRGALLKKFHLKKDWPTLLMMSGGYGVGQVREIVETLLEISVHYNFLMVAGRNERLLNFLKRKSTPATVNFRPLGFIENVSELMTVADLIVTKAGGLTVTECLVKGLPMILTDPIPGQEEVNADYVTEIGAGFQAHSLASLQTRVHQLLKDPPKLKGIGAKALAKSRPKAALDILHAVIG